MELYVPLRAAIALAMAILIAGPALAKSPCKDSLAETDNFWAMVEAMGIERSEALQPSKRPKEKLKFLDLAANAGFEGTVAVLLIIAPEGHIVDRVVICSNPFGYFEAGVLDWARDFGFTPLPPEAPQVLRGWVLTAKFRLQ